MNLNNKYEKLYNDEYEKMLIKIATASYIDDLGMSIEKKKKELEENQEFPFSEEEFMNFKKEIDRHNKKEQKVQWIKNISMAGSRVAIYLGIMGVIFIGGFTSVEAFRRNILNLIISSNEKYTKIILKDEEVNRLLQLPKEWEGYYYPHYIPKGFSILKSTIENGSGEIIYVNSGNKKIMYSIDTTQQSIFLDTEDIEVEEIMINEWTGQLIKKQNYYTVIFNNNECFFTVSGDISEKELINISKSIKK